MPRWRDSATFSAAWRQTLQERKRLSPSFHSLVCLSRNRGVEAIRNFATAAPLGVKRSSGSSTRLPTSVMTVSPAAMGESLVLGGDGRSMLSSRKVGLALVRTQDLGAQHGLVEVELAVELLDGGGLGLEVDDGVDALGLLRDLERHPATAPDVDLLDAAAVVLHDGQELVEGRSDGALLDVGVEDDHELVVTHAGNPPPLDYGGHGLSVAGGLLRLNAVPPG